MRKISSCLSMLLGIYATQSIAGLSPGIEDHYAAVTGAPFFYAAYEFTDGRAGAWCTDTALYNIKKDIKPVSIAQAVDNKVLKDVLFTINGYPKDDSTHKLLIESFDQRDGRRTFCVPYIHNSVNKTELTTSAQFIFLKDGKRVSLHSIPGEQDNHS